MNRLVTYQFPRGSALVRRSPWGGLENEIDQLFTSAFANFTGSAAPRFPVDVFEDKDNTYVRAELPGVSRDDIGVEVVDGQLNLTARRKDGERSVSFARSVSLSETVQVDKIGAAYENGVLTVTLPKQEQAKPRTITVAVK